MEIYNSDRKSKVSLLVDLIRHKRLAEAVNYFDYMNGAYAGYYMIAVLSRLTKEDGERFAEFYSERCDPSPKPKVKVSLDS